MDSASQLPVREHLHQRHGFVHAMDSAHVVDERWMSRLHSPSVSPLDDENLLHLILLRLPPHPSSLPRASLVCTRWRSILSDPQFLYSFRKHHQNPPLIGFFQEGSDVVQGFHPVLDPPDRIPAGRFSMPKSRSPKEFWDFMGCRHGLAVVVNVSRREIVVWDPLTGQQHRVTFPPCLDPNHKGNDWHAAVVCVDAEDGHVHGDCFLRQFKLVLIWEVGYTQAFGCLYESAFGVWGNIFWTAVTAGPAGLMLRPSILVGDTLCWLFCGGDILVFDFKLQTLGEIKKPTENDGIDDLCFQPLRMKDGGLGLAVVSELTVQLWERKSNCDGGVGWVLLQKTVPLEGMFHSRMSSDDEKAVAFVGYDEDTNVIVLTTVIGNFTLQLDSMQIKHVIKRSDICFDTLYPYSNFYAVGRRVAGGDDGAKNVMISANVL